VFYFSCPVDLDLESVDDTTVLGKWDWKWQSIEQDGVCVRVRDCS